MRDVVWDPGLDDLGADSTGDPDPGPDDRAARRAARNGARNGALRAAAVPAFRWRWWRALVDRGGSGAELDPARGRRAVRALLRQLGATSAEAADVAPRLEAVDVEAIEGDGVRLGVDAVDWASTRYPAGWRDLPDPPPVAWRAGRESDAPHAVALVGAPSSADYHHGPVGGSRACLAAAFAADLAMAGLDVAVPVRHRVDACAAGAWGVGGDVRMSAEAGWGWMFQHATWDHEVSSGWSGLAARSPRTPPEEGHPYAARLLAASTAALVVWGPGPQARAAVEAAIELGRPLLVVPDGIDTAAGRYGLDLLRDGAVPAATALDVFDALGWAERRRASPGRLERRCLDALGGAGATVDDVAQRVGISESQAAAYLLDFVARGWASRVGNRFLAAGGDDATKGGSTP